MTSKELKTCMLRVNGGNRESTEKILEFIGMENQKVKIKSLKAKKVNFLSKIWEKMHNDKKQFKRIH